MWRMAFIANLDIHFKKLESKTKLTYVKIQIHV
jgi:hypothetical protein